MGKQWKQWQGLFWGALTSLQIVTGALKLKDSYSLEEKWWSTQKAYLKAEILLYQQSPASQSYGFPSSYVWMWELSYKKSWVPKNWCFWNVVLEKTLESPLEIQPVHPKGNRSLILIGRTDAEAENPILWPPDVMNWLIGKDSDAGKDWRWEEKGITGWDCWMASLTPWTWVWVNSRNWWWTGRHGVPQSMELQRVRHNWVTELNWYFKKIKLDASRKFQ